MEGDQYKKKLNISLPTVVAITLNEQIKNRARTSGKAEGSRLKGRGFEPPLRSLTNDRVDIEEWWYLNELRACQLTETNVRQRDHKIFT